MSDNSCDKKLKELQVYFAEQHKTTGNIHLLACWSMAEIQSLTQKLERYEKVVEAIEDIFPKEWTLGEWTGYRNILFNQAVVLKEALSKLKEE